MPEDYKNLGTEPSQAPQGATELPVTPEALKGLSPEAVVEKLNNANKAIAEATRRNQEAAEQRRQIETEREETDRRRQELLEREEKFHEQLGKWQQPPPIHQTTTIPPSWETDPIAAGRALQDEFARLNRARDEDRRVYEEKYSNLESELRATQSATAFNEFLKEEIKPKYPRVGKPDIDLYFSERPTLKPDERTVKRAAEEIQKTKDAEVETWHQDYLKRKEAEAKEATLQGGGTAGSFEKVDNFIHLSEAEQAEILKKDALKLMKGIS